LGPSVKILDVGAGLGAMTWGIAHAIHAVHGKATVQATWVDADERALALADKLRAAWPAPPGLTVRAELHTGPADRPPRGTFDLVVLGQVLSELDSEDPARLERHTAWVNDLLRTRVFRAGSLVIVEPALAARARHLHAIRNGLLEAKAGHVFAPCVHQASCPALSGPRDWCHEDRDISLPDWLVPVARAAGLRFEGLTFSYLVMRRDARTVSEAFEGACDRVISGRLVSKGKEEVVVCGAVPEGSAQMRKLYRIDRDRSATNRAWESMGRGHLVTRAEALRVRSGAPLIAKDPSALGPREEE